MPNKPVKVLHIIHWPKSGIVSLVRNIISLLPESEIESHIVFFNYDKDSIEEFGKICKTAQALDFSSSFFKGLIRYYKILRQISPDILHSHSFQPGVWGCLFSLSKTKQISTIHNDYPYFRENNIKSLVKRILQKTFFKFFKTDVVVVSRKILQILSGFNLNPGKLFLIDNGIPITTHNFQPDVLGNLRKQAGLVPEEKLIISLGRLDRQKAFDILLLSLRDILQKYKNLKLMILGDGPQKKNLAKLADKLGITKHVLFLGFKSDPSPYLALADIYVCSSVYEGFGLAVAEAMLWKLPVVATTVGAIPEMITHGNSGILVKPNDPKAITMALDNLLSGHYDAELLGNNAKKTILNRYDIKRTANSYINLYKDTAGIR